MRGEIVAGAPIATRQPAWGLEVSCWTHIRPKREHTGANGRCRAAQGGVAAFLVGYPPRSRFSSPIGLPPAKLGYPPPNAVNMISRDLHLAQTSSWARNRSHGPKRLVLTQRWGPKRLVLSQRWGLYDVQVSRYPDFPHGQHARMHTRATARAPKPRYLETYTSHRPHLGLRISRMDPGDSY